MAGGLSLLLADLRRGGWVLCFLCSAPLAGCGGGGVTPNGSVKVSVITVSPAQVALREIGDTVRLSAQAWNPSGEPVPGVTFSWRLSDATVASLDQGGLVTAIGHGRTWVYAEVQQVTDSAQVDVPIDRRVVLVDKAHFNYHTIDGRYTPFAELLGSQGYDVRPSGVPISSGGLAQAHILVISNALAEPYWGDWSQPPAPAFQLEEINAVREWVYAGGSLLLIADHPPFAGAAESLAAAFGVQFHNQTAYDSTRTVVLPTPCGAEDHVLMFRRTDGTLQSHPITEGENAGRRIDSIGSFTGQAFETTVGTAPLMVFGQGAFAVIPDSLPWVPVGGWFQGVTLTLGEGRGAFFGEAAMFTAQPCSYPRGFDSPAAKQNPQFVLNVLHWLSGII